MGSSQESCKQLARTINEGVELSEVGYPTGTWPLQEQADSLQEDSVTASCRVCLEEDGLASLCQPCLCTGSMSHAHPGCIQHWINEKGDMLCEICKHEYKGSFEEPPPPPPQPQQPQTPAVRLSALRGFLISADSETGAFARRDFHEESAEFEQERASATWCLAAVLIFMMLLLVRHVFDVFSGPVYPDSGKPSELMVNSPEFTDGGVTFAWGTMNESDWNPLIDPWEAGKAAPPGQLGVVSSGETEAVSSWILLAWLLLRFSAVAIPALLAYCLMASFRDAQEQDETEQLHASMLANMEAGTTTARAEASTARMERQSNAPSDESYNADTFGESSGRSVSLATPGVSQREVESNLDHQPLRSGSSI